MGLISNVFPNSNYNHYVHCRRNKVWAQSHPMDCEELLTTQAEMVLALDPGIPGEQPRVWVYRNTIKALNWFASVREKLDDPAYSGCMF